MTTSSTSAADVCRSASVPMSLHLDHAQSEAGIKKAAQTGKFDSIMVDMSHYEKAENLARTKELVSYCHGLGIATEAEAWANQWWGGRSAGHR